MDFKKSSFKKPSSLRSKFTHGFVHALNSINKHTPGSQSLSSREIYKNYCKVKLAADASIAFAVGPKRAWSRALLYKVRGQQRSRLRSKRVKTRVTRLSPRKRAKLGKAKKMGDEDDHKVGIRQTKELRKLVPGGKQMDLCKLLTETAHYIQCLNTQVQVMRSLADFYSG